MKVTAKLSKGWLQTIECNTSSIRSTAFEPSLTYSRARANPFWSATLRLRFITPEISDYLPEKKNNLAYCLSVTNYKSYLKLKLKSKLKTIFCFIKIVNFDHLLVLLYRIL